MEYRKTIVVAATDADGVAAPQTLGAAGPLTLTASPVVIPGLGQLVTFTADADETGVDFTVTGTAPDGSPLVVVVSDPNAETVEVGVFKTIVSIVSDALTTGDVSAGWLAEGPSQVFPLDTFSNPMSVTVAVSIVSGTPTYTVEYTLDPVQDTAQINTPEGRAFNINNVTWFPDANLAGETTSQSALLGQPAVALRLNVAGASELDLVILQATG